MLGIDDPAIWLAYLLCILSSIACVIYGALNWNKGDDTVLTEDVRWAKEEKEEVERSF